MKDTIISIFMGYPKKSLSHPVAKPWIWEFYSRPEGLSKLSPPGKRVKPSPYLIMAICDSIAMDRRVGWAKTLSAQIAEIDCDSGRAVAVVTGSEILASIVTEAGAALVNYGSENSEIIFLALLPSLCLDAEFGATYDKFSKLYASWAADDFPERDAELDLLMKMSDNLYRRLNRRELDLPDGSKSLKVSEIKKGTFAVDESLVTGTLTVLLEGATEEAKKDSVLFGSALNGIYPMPGSLSDQERLLVPAMDDSFIVPGVCTRLAKYIYDSTQNKSKRKIRVLNLEGVPGSGKSTIAQAIAAALGKPFVTLVCNPATEVGDLYNVMMPKPSISTDEREIAILERFIRTSPDDIEFDPETACAYILGGAFTDATRGDILSGVHKVMKEMVHSDVLYERYESDPALQNRTDYETMTDEDVDAQRQMAKKMISASRRFTKAPEYICVESPLIQACRYGWVCEIQELNAIANEGVALCLNEMLERGTITLPGTGETFMRHPDTVVIITTNPRGEAFRSLDDAVIDRFQLVVSVDTPEEAVLIERTKAVTGLSDPAVIDKMIRVFTGCQIRLKQQGMPPISPRTLFSWASAYQISENIMESCLDTLLYKAAKGDDSVAQDLMVGVIEPVLSEE